MKRFFFHCKKTGGTTLGHLLQEVEPGCPATGINYHVTDESYAKYDVHGSHIFLNQVRHKFSFFTVMRDPLERMLSHQQMYRERPPAGDSIIAMATYGAAMQTPEYYATSIILKNHIYRYDYTMSLKGPAEPSVDDAKRFLDGCEYIILFEDYAGAVQRFFWRMFGHEVRHTPHLRRSLTKPEVTDEGCIREALAAEYKIYEHARGLVQEKGF